MTTKKGFIKNEMGDEKTRLYPDLYKKMKTCKLQDFKQEYKDLLVKNLLELYQTMNKMGTYLRNFTIVLDL